MSQKKIILFMGTQCGGMRETSLALRQSGLKVGLPNAALASQRVTRHQPEHDQLWYWRAVRRFFEDAGLPAIAEIPADRLSHEEREYHARVFARSLLRSLQDKTFICADHLTAFVLPLVRAALYMLAVEKKEYFFFSHPAREIWLLKHDLGLPARLAEFVWRNLSAAAGRHNRGQISFIDMDNLDTAKWRTISDEIFHFYDHNPFPEPFMPVLSTAVVEEMALSAETLNLYETMRAHASGDIDWRGFAAVASETWEMQVAQNGWQYLDCLECGEMDAHARRLLDQADYLKQDDSADLPLFPSGEESWEDLLDNAERKLLQAKQDYETRLFLQAQSLALHYINCLSDEKFLMERNLAQAQPQGKIKAGFRRVKGIKAPKRARTR